MGLAVLLSALCFYLFCALLYLSDMYNVYVFENVSQDMVSLAADDLVFDYIIIGAGTAGSLIATKMHDKNLLMLEAGAPLSLVPNLPIVGPLFQGSHVDWQYKTEAQLFSSKALKNRQVNWPRGKVFGGTHLLSNLIQLKGDPDEYRVYVDPRHPFDYDTDIGQYFQEYESLMQSPQVPFESEFSRLLKVAGGEIDFLGFHPPNVSVRNGLRFTTASLYEEQRGQNPDFGRNHTLLFNAMVDRLLMADGGRRVNGVQFTKGGQVYTARAAKGVIMSAGAIGSPAILLRSGIGPAEDLQELGIEPVVNLPVGQHLQDHVATGIDLVTVNKSLGTGIFDIMSVESLTQYFFQDEGLISMPGCDLVATARVFNSSQFDDLQFMIIPVGVNSDNGVHLRKILNFKEDVYYDHFHTCGGADREPVTILPVVLKPKSEGYLTLRSADANDPPIIDPKYLSHPKDAAVLLQGIRLIQKLVATEAMQSLGAKVKEQPFPGCEGAAWDSDEYWQCYIEHVTVTSYHPSGTCRMGSCPEDSVVDYNFKVHGVDNLYVVDASVMPELPAANPIATINMLALRFVDRL